MRNKIFNKCYRKTRKEFNVTRSIESGDQTLHRQSIDTNQVFASTSSDSPSFSNNAQFVPDFSDSDETIHNMEIVEHNIYISDSEVSSVDGQYDFAEANTSNQPLHFVEDNIKDTLDHQLAEWAVKYNVTQTAVTNLLHILKPLHPQLPLDARTLLNTPRDMSLKVVQPGVYYHFGFKNSIEKLMSVAQSHIKNSDVIEICMNIDGLPLSKSSGSQLYPILCNLFLQKTPVFVVGLYQGNEKPREANEFLQSFVNEAVSVVEEGFIFDGKKYYIKIKAFICDVPAKCFIKYVKSHTGYYSCGKCSTMGTYINRRVCFPDVNNLSLRNDSDYRLKSHEEHHTGTSILETIPGIDMISDFPLDYMHLICLGVVKKLIVSLWIEGKPTTKLSSHQISIISTFLSKHSSQIPAEFNRKSRSLIEVKRWKATEFRMFLLYLGPVVLKSVLSQETYIHFLTLHVAITILSSKKFVHLVDYADSLLKYFVKSFENIYGKEYISHNVHNLLHLCDDVKHFGPLDMFSAFPFENHMQVLKKFVRKGDKPIQQIVRRIHERNYISMSSDVNNVQLPELCIEHSCGPLLLNMNCLNQYKKVKFPNFVLSVGQADHCCCLNDNSLIIISNFVIDGNNSIHIIGHAYLKMKKLYTSPCNSSDLGIFICTDLGPLQAWPLSVVSNKCMKLVVNDDECVVFPLLHSE